MVLVIGLCIATLIILFIAKGLISPEARTIQHFYQDQGVIMSDTSWTPPKKVQYIPEDNIEKFLYWLRDKKKVNIVTIGSILTPSSIAFLDRKVKKFTEYSSLTQFLP